MKCTWILEHRISDSSAIAAIDYSISYLNFVTTDFILVKNLLFYLCFGFAMTFEPAFSV